MKRFKFVYLKEFLTLIVETLICITICIIVAASSEKENWLFVLACILIAVIILIVVPIYTSREVFLRYKITKNGIENGFLTIKYEEIKNFKVFFPEKIIRGWSKKEYPPVVCFGEINGGTFFSQSKKKCVAIPITQKNLELIKNFCVTENSAINELMSQFYGFGDYEY